MGLKNLDSKSIDLLMMTYGWRKYTLEESVLAYEEKREDNYDHLKINNPGPEKNGRSDIRLISPEGGGITILRLNESRETFLPFDSLDAYARQIMVLPDDDPSRNSNPVIVEFPENTVYTDSAKLIKTGSIYFKPEFAFIANDTSVFNQDRAIMIEAVTIKGKQTIQKKYVDKKITNFQKNHRLRSGRRQNLQILRRRSPNRRPGGLRTTKAMADLFLSQWHIF